MVLPERIKDFFLFLFRTLHDWNFMPNDVVVQTEYASFVREKLFVIFFKCLPRVWRTLFC